MSEIGLDIIEVSRGARTLLVVPESRATEKSAGFRRDRAARLEEARGLAAAIGLDVIEMRTVPVRNIRPATLIGTGHVDDIAAAIQLEKVSLAIVDSALSPIQQRNLETAWQCKVIDRTALILEIFGERAATAEGRLQVELAHLDYQAGRLVRSWTHLERQRGGFGFLGGPGETQIEADRRLIRNRMARIRKQLDEVRRTRSLHRQRRQRAPWPIVALVGYTNAGKSTLFNRLTASDVMAENLLFATLDPTMRRILVPGIGTTILSDTVGFVSALPTQLVAAFRATLEEVQAADLLLHVRDISHEDSEAQRSDVLDVLGELGIAEGSGPPIIEVWNKMDALGSDARAQAERRSQREGAVCISALTGAGIAMLEASLVNALGGAAIRRTVNVDVSDGAKQAWIHRHAQIISQRIDGQFVCYEITLAASDSARYDQL